MAAKIDRFYVEQFAYLLEKMNAVKEERGTLLDNSMIVYGGAISDGNRHNLFLSTLHRMRVRTSRFGDST